MDACLPLRGVQSSANASLPSSLCSPNRIAQFERNTERAHFSDPVFKTGLNLYGKLGMWKEARELLERQIPLCSQAKDDILLRDMLKNMLMIIVSSSSPSPFLLLFNYWVSHFLCVWIDYSIPPE